MQQNNFILTAKTVRFFQIFFFFFFFAVSRSLGAISISQPSSPPHNTLCSNQTATVNFLVTLTNGSALNAGNVFTVQICTTSTFTGGSLYNIYTSPVDITAGNKSYTFTVPAGITASTGYRMRVIASAPAINGAATSSIFYVNSVPPTPTNINNVGNGGFIYGYCAGSTSVPFSVTNTHTDEYEWTLTPAGTYGAIDQTPPYTNNITISFNSAFTGTTTQCTLTVRPRNCQGLGSPRTVYIKPTPAKPASIIGPSASLLCTGVQYAFSIPATGGATSYNWIGPAGFCTLSDVLGTPGSSNVLNGTTNTTVYITYTNAFTVTKNVSVTAANACGVGEIRTTSFTNDVVASPTTPTINVGGPLTFCQGSSVTLSTTSVGGVTYEWFNGSSSVGTGTSYVASASGVYTVKATATTPPNCGSTSAAVTVTVNPAPVVTVTANPASVCPGGTTDLTASPTGSYLWSDNSTSNPLTNVPAGTYTVTVTDANGCSEDGSITVSNLNLNVSVVANPLVMCEGSSTTLTPTVTGASGAISYLWSDGDAGSVTPPPRTITPNSTASYYIQVTNQGCTFTSNSETVTVNSLPVPVIVPTGSLCGTQPSIVLSTSLTYTSYIWSDGVTTYNTSTHTTSVAGNFSVTVTDANNCTGSASINIPAGTLPVSISPSNPSFCAGESVTLTATSPSATSFIWSPPGTPLTLTSINVNTGGTYTVTVDDGAGCSGTASVNVIEYSPPSVTATCAPLVVCPACTAQLDATVTPGSSPTIVSYNWTSFPSNIITSLNSSSIEDPVIDGTLLTAPGTFNILITDLNGCTASATSPQIQPIQISVDASLVNSGLSYSISGPGITMNAISGNVVSFSPSGGGMPQILISIPAVTGTKPVEISFQYNPINLNIDASSVQLKDGSTFFPLNSSFYSIPNDEPTKIIFFKDAKKNSPLNITTSLTNGIIQSSASNFQINIPSANSFSGSTLLITPPGGGTPFSIPLVGSTFIWNPGGATLGLYDFEVTLSGNLNNSPTPKTYKGQFILTQ